MKSPDNLLADIRLRSASSRLNKLRPLIPKPIDDKLRRESFLPREDCTDGLISGSFNSQYTCLPYRCPVQCHERRTFWEDLSAGLVNCLFCYEFFNRSYSSVLEFP